MSRHRIVQAQAIARSGGSEARSSVSVVATGDEAPAVAESPLALIASLPVSGRTIVAFGLVVAVMGVALPLLLVDAWSLIAFLVHGGVLLPVGVSTTAIGGIKAHLDARVRAARHAESEAIAARDATAVRSVLRDDASNQTVEWIAAKVALPEPRVVAALLWLRKRGEIDEELDTDAGEWFYRPTHATRSAGLTLDDRAAHISRGPDER